MEKFGKEIHLRNPVITEAGSNLQLLSVFLFCRLASLPATNWVKKANNLEPNLAASKGTSSKLCALRKKIR